jgi:hypothetical protein
MMTTYKDCTNDIDVMFIAFFTEVLRKETCILFVVS